MPRLETERHTPLVDLSGLSLKDLDDFGGRTLTEALHEVLDPSSGEIASAGFDAVLEPQRHPAAPK